MGDASILSAWDNFYVIVGSSAGALIGLQFVVIALISDRQVAGSMLEIRAFGTPTVVHFCFALVIAGIMAAPWHSMTGAAVCMAACGVVGVAYSLLVIRHARRQRGYAPDSEDWFWYAGSPLGIYFGLLATALVLTRHPDTALFALAAIALALLFLGIHNAWDTVTYVAMGHKAESKNAKEG